MDRKFEYFTYCKYEGHNSVGNIPPKLFKQERDWTCSIACIRTLLSGIIKDVESEEFFIDNYKLIPGPHFSKDIKRLHILDKFNVVYGCDEENFDFVNLLNLLNENYFIMVESMINYSHWLVFLGYFSIKDKENIEQHKILLYDPYYDSVRLENADEFIGMWIDGEYLNTNVKKDFIAIKKEDS